MTPREKYSSLHESSRKGFRALELYVTDPIALDLLLTQEKVMDKLFDDLDALCAFLTEPQPQSLRAERAPVEHIAPVHPPTASRGAFTLIEGGKA